MKWKKLRRSSRRASYYEFWDGTNSDDELVCYIRLDTRHKHYEVFADTAKYYGMETGRYTEQRPFKTLKDAKDHCVAWLVNKRLEEA
jgi:hypothetical protein